MVVGALLATKEGAGGILPHHRGIDHHKGLAGVGRALVDALGKKSLAGAALAKDHDVLLGLGQLFPRRHGLGDGHRIAHKVFPLVPGHKFLGIRRLFPAAAVRQHGNEHSHLAVALLELSLHTAHHGTVEQVDVVGLDLAALIKRVIRERGNQLAQLQAPELAALQAHQSFCLLVERGNAVVLIGDDDARRHVPDQRVRDSLLAGGGLQLRGQKAGPLNAGADGVLTIVDEDARQPQPLGHLHRQGRSNDAITAGVLQQVGQLRLALKINGLNGDAGQLL